jgi:glycerol dehydrogenase-like iron-containing ADH family enzyme
MTARDMPAIASAPAPGSGPRVLPPGGFTTVFGRELVAELPAFVHRPWLVVTMADLWPRFEAQLSSHLAGVHLVSTLELDELERAVEALPACAAIVGLGGGQALDVAKFFAWRRRLPLFQVPTATTVNAPYGHRSGLRDHGRVRYMGWAIPEAVYIDFDVIGSAPPLLNRSGVGDVLCYHTARRDWELADRLGRTEPKWPFDAGLVADAATVMGSVVDALDEIHDGTEAGIRAVVLAHRWGGTTFHDSGWNPRHIEGVEHFVFYNLERITGRHFIHGQPVGLGIVAGSLLQDNEPEHMAAAMARVGVDIRPEAMGVTWDDVGEALRTLPTFVRDAGLWFTVADTMTIGDEHVARVREVVDAAFGPWTPVADRPDGAAGL